MKHNAVYYLFSQLTDCCREHYDWNYIVCINGQKGAYSGLYYPDFEGENERCLNGGNRPAYMNNAPQIWMKTSLEECCMTNYEWNKEACMDGGASAETPVGNSTPGDSRWYVNHKDEICQQNCPVEGGGACGGIAERWEGPLFDTAVKCCADMLQWLAPFICEAKSKASVSTEGPDGDATSGGVGSSLDGSTSGDSMWYVNHREEICQKNCPVESGGGCGGIAEEWDVPRLNTSAECCAQRLPWLPPLTCEAKSNPSV